MDNSVRISSSVLRSSNLCLINHRSSSSSRFLCSQRNPDESPENNNGDNRSSRDWDKAWKSFKKQSKKTFFSQFNVDKYVTWNPPRSEFPLSEEVDPIKRTERSNLMLWTSPKFTLVGAIVIVSFLLLYTILAPVK
ncbi:uncharacterized protein LOC108869040 [Brassica rapa]|uniref:Uncharacterized protein n=2 Tax=Brassica TaxID=3705 RepID=A0A3P6B0D5_BRACM|nr:uncharacterized protein LOC108869040 [Brassica rapa]XP_033131735.1 uncharacterized protein LOC108869040 [Brassica rapa]CAF2157235.1 unnamed protein product [Brassica napus]CAG7900694.1 unnamed protein product [Brassica rapa]CDY38153.1 BnaA07g02300D [Brassica napus]VDC95575.1 unnamed protein product [Brassica rapa]